MKPFVRKAVPFVSAAVALALMVPSAVVSVERQQTIDEARAAVVRADAAVASYWDARYQLADAVARASALAAADGSLDAVAEGVDAAALKGLHGDLAALAEFATTDAVANPETGGPTTFEVARDDAATDAARDLTEAADEGRGAWTAAEAEVQQAEATLAMHLAAAQFGWVAFAEGAPTAAKALIAANASATADHQKALTEAAAAIDAQPDGRVAALAAYAKAIAGVKKSHTDEQARIAAEAAAAAAAAKKRKKREPVIRFLGEPTCVNYDTITGAPWQEEWWFDGVHQIGVRCTWPVSGATAE